MNPRLELVTYRPIDWIEWLPRGRYRVGNDGSVWSIARGKWKPLKARKPKGKGPCVRLTGPEKKSAIGIAYLVCRAFHGPRPIGCEPYRFPDGDLRNNHASNLKWAPKGTHSLGITPKAATKTAGRRNLQTRVESLRQLQEGDIPKVFELRREGWTLQEIADELMTSQYVISSVTKGRVYSSVSCDRSIPDGLKSRGDRHPGAKLTSLDIPEIREKRRSGKTIRLIAQEYGVSCNAILQIFRGRSWAHIPDQVKAHSDA